MLHKCLPDSEREHIGASSKEPHAARKTAYYQVLSCVERNEGSHGGLFTSGLDEKLAVTQG